MALTDQTGQEKILGREQTTQLSIEWNSIKLHVGGPAHRIVTKTMPGVEGVRDEWCRVQFYSIAYRYMSQLP